MTNNNSIRQLKLHSPAGVEPATFTWVDIEQQQSTTDGIFSGGEEIVQTIRLVFEDYPELYQENLALDYCDIQSYSQIKELCDKFNKIIDTYSKLNRGTEAFSARIKQRATSKLFRHLLAQVYSRAVTDPDKLRDYEPFSPSVYGETSPDLVDSILKVLDLNEDETFIDLGSGVGNVVLQVAALANCKYVYGIEHETIPATYACAMENEFRFWMRWYGKCYSDFQLEQGDFLHQPQIDERIREADVIFANNYVFGSTVNHELKIKFMSMNDGARIISSREFCSETFRLNDRTRNDLGAVMYVTKPEQFFGKVSWSDKCVQYYLHVIDHRKLAHFYEKTHHVHTKASKLGQLKQNDDDTSVSSSSINSSSNSSHSAIIKTKSSKRKSPSSSNNCAEKMSRKPLSDHLSDLDGNLSQDTVSPPKRHHGLSTDYQTRLHELQIASKEFIRANHNRKLNNDNLNYLSMSKLSHENRHTQNYLFEQDDQQSSDLINSHLEQFRQRLFTYFTYTKSNTYREHVQNQLHTERELNQTLKSRISCLENNIKVLLEDTINLLKLRTQELDIEELQRPEQLLNYASDISNKHKELRLKVVSFEKEIEEYDDENNKINLILTNLNSNQYQSSGESPQDNTYSTLLANMSRQTQSERSNVVTRPITSTLMINRDISGINLDVLLKSNSNSTSSYNKMKSERKTDFIIQKRSNKLLNLHLNGTNTVSSIQITDCPAASLLPSTIVAGIDNIQAANAVEPVQVHSLVSSADEDKSASQVTIQPFNVNTVSSKKMPSVITSHDLIGQLPRKKRDFYGKSSGPTAPSSISNQRSNRHLHNTDPLLSMKKHRPASTPAFTDVLLASTLPDRPGSIPPLKTSL